MLRADNLKRELGVASAAALVISSMIGTGIFTTTGFLAGDLGSSRIVMWNWVAGGVRAAWGALLLGTRGQHAAFRRRVRFNPKSMASCFQK